jgi:structure-specific recognition protein 1
MDMLCEMRFHVPNNELELYDEERIQAKEAKRKANNKKPSNEESKEDNKAQSDDDDSDEEMTAAKLFNNKVVSAAGIGQFAGEIICSIQDLPMIIPRGKISLDFYAGFAKLHGKTHDYKINYKDI